MHIYDDCNRLICRGYEKFTGCHLSEGEFRIQTCKCPNTGTGSGGGGSIGPQRPEATPGTTGDYCTGQQGGFGCWCPILIDVNGDGFDLTSYDGGVPFDLNADGLRGWISWTERDTDDAWLCLDRNGNGLIDDGTELFGNVTPQADSPDPNGFNALAEFDMPHMGGNGDRSIDYKDFVFESLLLWQDRNHTGSSEPGELKTLSSCGISSISLSYKTSRRIDGHGNHFRYRAKLGDTPGASVGRWAWDVFLVAQPQC